LQAAKNQLFGFEKTLGHPVFSFGKNRVGNPRS